PRHLDRPRPRALRESAPDSGSHHPDDDAARTRVRIAHRLREAARLVLRDDDVTSVRRADCGVAVEGVSGPLSSGPYAFMLSPKASGLDGMPACVTAASTSFRRSLA